MLGRSDGPQVSTLSLFFSPLSDKQQSGDECVLVLQQSVRIVLGKRFHNTGEITFEAPLQIRFNKEN